MKPEAYEKNFAFEDRYWWFRVRNRLVLEQIRRHTPGAGMQVLDYGCGTGKMLDLMSGLGQVRGADVSETALAFCRRRGHENLVLLDPDAEPPGTYDLITLLDVIEHVDDDRGLVARLAGRLSPGGVLVATAPALPCLASGEDYVSGHKRRYLKKDLRAAIEGGGLHVLRLTYFNTLLLLPIFLFIRVRALLNPDTLRHSNLTELPGPLNALFAGVFGLEIPLLRVADLPLGMSLLCVAKKQ